MPVTLEMVFWIAALGGAGTLFASLLLGAAGHAALHMGGHGHAGGIDTGHGHAALGDGGGHAHVGGLDAGHGHAALGDAGGHGHAGPHGDGGAHAHAHTHTGDAPGFDWGDIGQIALSYLNPAALALATCYFGLWGLLLYRVLGLWPVLSVIASVVFGLALARGTCRVVFCALGGGFVSSQVEVRELVGQLGEVTTGIPAKGLGEIAVVIGGARSFYPARADVEIPHGTRVFLERIEEGVAQVSPFDELPQPPPELSQ